MMHKLTFNSRHKTQMIDITKDVKETVIKSGVKNGAVLVFVPHSTCSVFVSEHIDPNLTRDLLSKLHDLVPASGSYHHAGENADAHIKAAVMGASTILPIQDATVIMGEWQGIFLTDFDGPRERDLYIKVLG